MKHLKHLQHTLATSEEGREREVQPEKPTPGLATPDLMTSRAEVERCGSTGVGNGHDLLVGNSGIDSTSTRRGTGHGAQEQGPGTTRRGRVSTMANMAPPRVSLVRANGAVSHDERSEKLGISVSCRNIDGVDRRDTIGRHVGPVVVLERVQS
jgi:hypothetical protein